MRKWIDMVLMSEAVTPTVLYHATNAKNIPSIEKSGLLVNRYGEIHGSMDYHPPEPCVYLSRNKNSNNLHTNLFNNGDVVVFAINLALLDEGLFYPDDAIGYAFEDEKILASASAVQRALGTPAAQSRQIFEDLENASDDQLLSVLKPFWRWWLTHRLGGEVAYAGNIPPSAIISYRPID